MDDEEAVRATVTSMLELLGFEVISAADGLEAVELFGSLSAPAHATLRAIRAAIPDSRLRGARGGAIPASGRALAAAC